jgi:hypothetical protein
MEQPSERRRITRRKYDMAETRIRKIFSLDDDEMILDLIYDKPNSTLILTTLRDSDKDCGDI